MMQRLTVCLIVLLAATAPAMDAQTEFCAALSPGAPIFNGSDLEGWSEVGGGKWSVVDGEIVGETGDGSFGWLTTQGSYRDFSLFLEFKIEAPGNSGVQFRSHVVDDVMYGYQAEVDPRPTHGTGGVYEQGGRGWLVKPDEKGLAAMRVGEWNQYLITARGSHIVLAGNGVTTADFHDERFTQGHIALQVHSGETPVKVRWRNVYLIEQDPVQRLKADGFAPMFDGETLEGWHVAGEERWEVRDGEIVGSNVTGAYGYLVSQWKYRDFAVRLSFLVEGPPYGNSGFFFRSAFQGVNVKGLQAEITGHAGDNAAGLFESGGRGWLVVPNEVEQKLVRPSDWNTLEVRARGPHVQTHLNGWRIVDVTDEAFLGDGNLALQLHSGEEMRVRFKDVWFKEL